MITRDYLTTLSEEDARTANSAGLIAATTERLRNGAIPILLELGAKVAKSEMKWG